MLLGMLCMSKGERKQSAKKMALNSGATTSIIVHEFTKELKVKQEPNTDWDTPAGKFATRDKVATKGKVRFAFNCWNDYCL